MCSTVCCSGPDCFENFIIEPFIQGGNSIYQSLFYSNIQLLSEEATCVDLTFRRVRLLIIGIILIIPVVNTIIFLAMCCLRISEQQPSIDEDADNQDEEIGELERTRAGFSYIGTHEEVPLEDPEETQPIAPLSKMSEIDGKKLFHNDQLFWYFLYLKKKYHEELFGIGQSNPISLQGIRKTIFNNLYMQNYYNEKKNIAYPLHVTNNHWTLVFIDREQRTVEYYDSKIKYGNFKDIQGRLMKIAMELTEKDPGETPYQLICKIQTKLQPDGYQCGAWVLYFLENRLENPDIDFNELNIKEAQKIIAKYRIQVMRKLIQMDAIRQSAENKEFWMAL